ncbi:MAG: methyl-accepting chemotaxis protein [Fimbriimonas sp.]
MKTWFGNLRLALKLALGFGLCLTFSGVVVLTALSGIRALNGSIDDLTDNVVPSLVALQKIDGASRQVRIYQFRLAGMEDEATTKQVTAELDAAREEVAEAMKAYEATLVDAIERENIAALRESWSAYDTRWLEIAPRLATLDSKEGFALIEAELTPLFAPKILPQLSKIAEFDRSQADSANRLAKEASSRGIQTVFAVLALATLASVGFSIAITRLIVAPLNAVSGRLVSLKDHCLQELNAGLKALAEGDLTVNVHPVTKPINPTSKDEVGLMAATFDEALYTVQESIGAYHVARNSLTELVRRLADNAEQVASTSQTLAASSQESGAASHEIAQGSQKLAISASEAAAVMEQLAAQVAAVGEASSDQRGQVRKAGNALQQSAEGIDGVAASAQTMEATALEGNAAVRETVDAMARVRAQAVTSSEKVRELDQRGREIGDIVRTIEGIAEQTNLLALNAAIEAARAGEHGRGFAVVADEVRKLAEQAATSTKQISELINSVTHTVSETVVAIEGTTREIAAGAERSERAGQSLAEILGAARQVAEQAEAVAVLTQTAAGSMKAVAAAAEQNAHAADEMARGADRVVGSIAGVAAVSEEAAAGAEELTASIEQVGSVAGELAHMSQSLQELVARFRVEEAAVQSPVLRLKVAA